MAKEFWFLSLVYTMPFTNKTCKFIFENSEATILFVYGKDRIRLVKTLTIGFKIYNWKIGIRKFQWEEYGCF